MSTHVCNKGQPTNMKRNWMSRYRPFLMESEMHLIRQQDAFLPNFILLKIKNIRGNWELYLRREIHPNPLYSPCPYFIKILCATTSLKH